VPLILLEDVVDNNNSKKNRNKGGYTGNSINRKGDGYSGTMVGNSSGVASIGNGDGEPSNACQEHVHHYMEPDHKVSNQELKLQDSPALVDGNTN
jgi:hypothetical protein